MKTKKKKSIWLLAGIFSALFLFFFFLSSHMVAADPTEYLGGDSSVQNTAPSSTKASEKASSNWYTGFATPGFWSFLTSPIDSALAVILSFVGILLGMAVTVFEWIVDPEIGKTLMDNDTIYEMWTKVRDTFNFLFIMVLLFSAFATVFQVTKYNYQKIVLHLVLMALLVNFSFPIARFLIDVSNVLMYELINETNADTLVNEILAASKIEGYTKASGDVTLYLLSAIVFVFILAITLLVIGVLLLIRVITLTIYLIFSPIAFVGSILPGTKLASVADDWWRDFMKYCFAGPTMVFMIYIASEIIKITANFATGINTNANGHVPTGLTPLIVSAIMCSIPVIILWYGIIIAQQSGLAGANAVVGAGKKAMKKLSGANWVKRNYDDYKKVRDERKSEARWKPGKKIGDSLNNTQDRLVAGLGSTKAQARLDKRRAAKNREEIKKESEDSEGSTTINLVNNTTTNITTPPPTKDAKIKAAGQAKQALSRGKEFETELDNRIAPGGSLAPGSLIIQTAILARELPAAPNANQIKAWYFSKARSLISSAEKA